MTGAGWTLFLAAIGVMAGLLGHEIAQFPSWDVAITPAFVGKSLIHFGSVVGAFVGGKLLPGPGPRSELWTPAERANFRASDEGRK